MAINNTSDKAGGTESVASDERRRAKRFPFSAEIEALEPKSGAVILGRISDLASGGCYVDTMSPFPLGTHLRVRIRKNKEFFEAQAKVVHSQPNMGMGLLFVSAKQDQVSLFRKWLLELSGASPRQPGSPTWGAREEAIKKAIKAESADALAELVTTLMRKGVLTESEGTNVLRKLTR